jgi:hypothetical protein
MILFPYDAFDWVILGSILFWLIILGVADDKFNDSEIDFKYIFLLALLIGTVTAFLLTAPDPRTATEKLNDELTKSNLTIESMVILDEGKVFKFNENYYIKVNNDQVIKLDSEDAKFVYEK